jgi:hypothetical protein
MKITIEFPISKRITVAQFKTTSFSIEPEKGLLVSYLQPIRNAKYGKVTKLAWCDTAGNHVMKTERQVIEKGISEKITKNADIFDYLYQVKQIDMTSNETVFVSNGTAYKKSGFIAKHIKKMYDDLRDKLIAEYNLDKNNIYSIKFTKEPERLLVNRNKSATGFHMYELNINVKLIQESV